MTKSFHGRRQLTTEEMGRQALRTLLDVSLNSETDSVKYLVETLRSAEIRDLRVTASLLEPGPSSKADSTNKRAMDFKAMAIELTQAQAAKDARQIKKICLEIAVFARPGQQG